MKSVEFAGFLKQIRQQKEIPQRIVAARLDIDTSTLSKIELGERQVSIAMIKGLAEVLNIDFKELQIRYITEKILKDFEGQEFLTDALKITLKRITS